MGDDVFQVSELVDLYWVAPWIDFEENSNFHVTENSFVDVDAEELNVVLSSNGQAQVCFRRFVHDTWAYRCLFLLVYCRGKGKCSPSPWHCSWNKLHTGVPMVYFCRYILKAKGTVPLLPGTIHGTNYKRVYQKFVSVNIFHRRRELFPFSLALFIEQITYGYTNGLFSSIYFRDKENCSLHMSVITIKVFIFPMESPTDCELQRVGTECFY
jgi:hypothetical protein